MASSMAERRPDVVEQLNEVFGNMLNLDVIETVASACQYDVQKSSNKLLEISSKGGNFITFDPRGMSGNPMHIKQFASTGAINKTKSRKLVDIEKTIELTRQGYKVLVILRGLPGSGKSYLAKQLLQISLGEAPITRHILSTDDYFLQRGAYKFDPQKLPEAHGWNHNRAFKAMSKGISPVIIDNTNTQMWEMKPYAVMGTDFGYIIKILEPDTHWSFNDKELTKRNSHGVNKQKIREMLERFDKNVTTEKLLSAYSLQYKHQKPPQFRKIPAYIPPINNKNNHVPVNNVQVISKSQSASALNQPSYRAQRKLPTESINLMEFNDIPSSFVRLNGCTDHLSVDNWNDDPIDQMLMWKPNNTSNEIRESEPICVDSDEDNNSDDYIVITEEVKANKPAKTVDIETAWGVNENAIRSWDIVTPLPDDDYIRNEPQVAYEKAVTNSDASCSTNDWSDTLTDVVIHTFNRDINVNTPKKFNGIPKKIMIDKGCMTVDVGVDEEVHLEQLKIMFPFVAEKHLVHLYKNCKGDIDWTIELLLDCKEDLESLVDKDADDIPDIIPEPNEERVVSPVSSDASAENKPMPKRRYVQSEELKSCLFKAEQHKRSNIKHNNKRPKPSTSKLESCMTNAIEVIDSDMEFDDLDLDEKSDCGAVETVELNLGDAFAEQLETRFGDPNITYPKGFQPLVQVPIDFARQLYTFYIESVFQQMDAQNEVMESLVKEDEELARKLQAQDQQNWLALETSEQNLNLSGQWSNLTPETLADKLTKQKLFQTFPSVNRNVLVEIFQAHNNNYQDTVETLIASAGEESIVGKPEEAKKPPINETIIKELQEAHESSQNYQPSDERLDATHYRTEANKHLQKRGELHQRAQSYYQRGMLEVAQFYSSLASKQTNYFDTANQLAAQTFLHEHSERLQDFNTIDLHFLYVKEAIPALDVFIDRNINLLQGGEKNYEYLHIITGRGNRSLNGMSKLKPAVIGRLKKRHLRYNQMNPGLLRIKVTKNSLVTSNLPS